MYTIRDCLGDANNDVMQGVTWEVCIQLFIQVIAYKLGDIITYRKIQEMEMANQQGETPTWHSRKRIAFNPSSKCVPGLRGRF